MNRRMVIALGVAVFTASVALADEYSSSSEENGEPRVLAAESLPAEEQGSSSSQYDLSDPESQFPQSGNSQFVSQGVPPAPSGGGTPSYVPAPMPAPTPPPAAPKPFKPLFFDNDFSYKRNPNHPHVWGEELKEMPFCDDCADDRWISFGGELRYRYMDEDNRLRPGGPGRSTYNLWRWRNYVDMRFSKQFRVYVEGIDASIFDNELPVTGIDKNRWDLQNYFFDLQVAELNDQSVYFRYGRQELLYGNQRLVSPLDWANTRRNFEGFKLFSKGQAWDIDAFAVQPVNTASGGSVAEFDNKFDQVDGSRHFSGVYASYHGVQNNVADYFWLWDRETDFNLTGIDYSRQTVGTRWYQDRPVTDGCGNVSRIWHTEIEGGYQFGHQGSNTVKAGYFTAGGGHTWKAMPWSPSLWAFYDWASGDKDPTDDENNTFFQVFPLAHAYLGWIDNVARQNISDVNMRLVVNPTQKLSGTVWMHWMDLDNQNDFIYNVAGAPVGTTNVGREIGEELDLMANYQFNTNFSVQVAYLWYWYGSAVVNGPLNRDDANLFYVQTTLQY